MPEPERPSEASAAETRPAQGTAGEHSCRPISAPIARRFVEDWVARWNSRDVEGLLRHFADEVVFTSPVAVRLLGGDGVLRGKQALRHYWTEGVRRIPDLHFEIVDYYVGVSTIVIRYRNQTGALVSEVLVFDGDLVVEGHGTYCADGVAALKTTPA
jgi:hypothetical protein